jgi:hypothetical protein
MPEDSTRLVAIMAPVIQNDILSCLTALAPATPSLAAAGGWIFL